VARAVVIDCFSGASGDMLLGALLDAGVRLGDLRAGLGRLAVGGWSLDAEAASQHGIGGTRARVRLAQADQPHRGLSAVLSSIAGADLPTEVAERACAVFRLLGEVEAGIHGTSVEEVEFHEVGALDAIVDVVGVVYGLHLLGADFARIGCEGVPLGSGWVRAAHGRLPVPAPATLEIVRRTGLPIRRSPGDGSETGELTTPTGAALLGVLARPGVGRLGRVESIGYGFGSREPPWPNAVRLIIGSATASTADLLVDEVVEIQTNLDDSSPEELGFAMERLLEAGALDVAFSPLQMKKNRPGVLLRVLARPGSASEVARLVLEHTSALGVRMHTLERLITRRESRVVATPWGEVRVKVKLLDGREIVAPEYEDCARLAREAGVPLRQIYASARAATDGS
jgi:pyridinium-3,5-bisthiocarboxylic acid mononucleotide nickel chelatase